MNNYQPKVTIITPTYNHEKYIGQCIDSVFNQSYPYWEMIIIDDESNDTTPEIISRISDPRVKYFRQLHKGPQKLGETYNFALSKSSGELIAILEGDDFWPHNKLELQIKPFEDPTLILSFGQFIMAYDADGIIKYKLPLQGPLCNFSNNSPIGSAIPFILRGISVAAVTIMIKKEALDAIGGFKQFFDNPYVDFPTLLELSLHGRFHYHPNILGFFRRHKKSIMYNQNKNFDQIQKITLQKNIYFKSFLEKNRVKIKELDQSYEILESLIADRKNIDPALFLFINGKESLEIESITEARATFYKILSIHPKMAFIGLAWVGIISTYVNCNLCDIVLKPLYLFQSIKQTMKNL